MPSINITYAQAQQLLQQFAGDDEDEVVALYSGEGHSGKGIYAGSSEYPEEGSEFLGPES